MSLRGCPFCRELFADGERTTCPVCEVPLLPFEKLPVSHEAMDGETPPDPEWEPLPLTYFRRGRGVLPVLALAGLTAFVSPWVHVTMPDIVTYSGVALAHRLGWPWGAGVGWFVLLPVVLSRRSIVQMRGARVAASFLAAVPGTSAALLLARPPHGGHGVPLHFTFEWGIYTTLGLSGLAVLFAFFFGGRLDDIRVRRGSSEGQVVH